MKLNGSMLVAVVMMVGSVGALGCKSSEPNAQPEDSAVAAQPAADTAATEAPAAKDESINILAKTSVSVGQQQTPAPPVERMEYPGRAPSRDHVWIKGHWKQERTGYVWVNGRWSHEHARSAPPPARYENPGRAPSARHFWVNGHHKYQGGRYVWISGRWDTQRGNSVYVQPRHEREHGHWRYVPGRWVRR